MRGLVQETPQNESTPFHPRSPYAVAKLYSYWMCINYREAYGMHVMVFYLIARAHVEVKLLLLGKLPVDWQNIALGLETCLYMGNINALRDWGHAKDYVRMQWMMLQQEEAKDYVIATGKQHLQESLLPGVQMLLVSILSSKDLELMR